MVSVLSWSLLMVVCTLNVRVGEVTYTLPGTLSSEVSFNINGESNLDLEYAMSLVTSKQNVTLYQVGDLIEGLKFDCITRLLPDLERTPTGASFNNFLDAIDGTYCTFEGGDDSSQDAVYPDTQSGGYNGQKSLIHVLSI